MPLMHVISSLHAATWRLNLSSSIDFQKTKLLIIGVFLSQVILAALQYNMIYIYFICSSIASKVIFKVVERWKGIS